MPSIATHEAIRDGRPDNWVSLLERALVRKAQTARDLPGCWLLGLDVGT